MLSEPITFDCLNLLLKKKGYFSDTGLDRFKKLI